MSNEMTIHDSLVHGDFVSLLPKMPKMLMLVKALGLLESTQTNKNCMFKNLLFSESTSTEQA